MQHPPRRAAHPPLPRQSPPRPSYPVPSARRRPPRAQPRTLVFLGVGIVLIMAGLCMIALLSGAVLLYGSGHILPGVSTVGVDIGGMDQDEAAAVLAQGWASRGIVLRDGERTWTASPAELGIALDAAATAAAAHSWGRSEGGIAAALRSVLAGAEVEPVLAVDLPVLVAYLQQAKLYTDLPAVNAGVQLVSGQAAATSPVDGRWLDVAATVEVLRVDAGRELADGALDLIMVPLAPAVTDATPLVAQANALLAGPFNVDAYDPIRDEWLHWTAPPEAWAAWLTAAPAPDSPTGLALAMNSDGPAAFLQASSGFGDERYIDTGQAAAVMQSAIARSQTSVLIRVWHHPTTYTVQAGQTLAAIAEEVGIPYPYIQAANPEINADALSAGQVLTLPSKDMLVPLDPIPNQRIIISRGQQHLWAYENGQVVFDWVISTGLSSSPTALGVFQIQAHDLNAYADQWNLYMPHFMGFYHPGPNMDLMNGFHGFPTRGGGYLLWTDDLGHPVTYGCVLLSLENAEILYNWAQDGVVVEVRG